MLRGRCLCVSRIFNAAFLLDRTRHARGRGGNTYMHAFRALAVDVEFARVFAFQFIENEIFRVKTRCCIPYKRYFSKRRIILQLIKLQTYSLVNLRIDFCS